MKAAIENLIGYALKHHLIEEIDVPYIRNQVCFFLAIPSYQADSLPTTTLSYPSEALNILIEHAIKHNQLNDSIDERDAFDVKLMNLFLNKPSCIEHEFQRLYKQNPETATTFFYTYAKTSNYIRQDRIARDVSFSHQSPYGKLDITINLSKPEKDIHTIKAEKEKPVNQIPTCLLCRENEGYPGHVGHPARDNLRLLPVTLEGEPWFFQYSPYVYYQEHAIVLSKMHRPMVINGMTFRRLLGFVDWLPHYFIGSNADLPIVGGSILAHDHFQAGHAKMPIENAKTRSTFHLNNYQTVVSILDWPLSTLRLESKHKEELIILAERILNKWRDYDAIDQDIVAYTDEPHNTITPIARKSKTGYQLDLMLRNNRQTAVYPEGIFHPHRDVQHIKKENIGLIEAMGLAILPGRLHHELKAIKKALLQNQSTLPKELTHHETWYQQLKTKDIHKDGMDAFIERELGKKFTRVLEDAGVFKQHNQGQEAFVRFVKSLEVSK